jgi:RNA polymerase sigma-70 factor, ECF subfamily
MPAPALDELLSRSAQRDQQAFAALYKASAPKLFAVAVRITRRRDWAEEVLQESYVSIWHHAQGYDPGKSAPMTWMTTIVRNRALDWLRRPRETESNDVDALIAAVPDDSPGPEDVYAQMQDAGRISECLGDLTDDQRQSITLAFFHGMSHGELASQVGKPLGTVKTWIRRGLDRLKACMERFESP